MSSIMSKLNLSALSGFSGFSNFTGGKLLQKRSWIVVVGDDAPVGEVNNANSLATFLRRKFNAVPIRGAWKATYAETRARIKQYTNVLMVGGPIASETSYKLNELCEPKVSIRVVREKTAEETWKDYVLSGGLVVDGCMVNGVKIPYAGKTGIIGVGQQKMGIRASQVVGLFGYSYEDTCVLVKAFQEVGADAGVYDVNYTAAVPNKDVNPENMTYTKRP